MPTPIIMTSLKDAPNPETDQHKPASDSQAKGIFDVDNRQLMLYHMALPGALGGIAKFTWEQAHRPYIQAPAVNTTQANVNSPPAIAQRPEVGLFSSVFLGIISALIGTLVLSDLVELKKVQLKVFGLSLVFGLFFPSVFELAERTLTLQNQQESLQTQQTATTAKAIEQIKSLATESQNPETKAKAVSSISTLAQDSNNEQVKADAARTIGTLATDSANDTQVQQEAISEISSLASSADERTKMQAVEALGKIAETTADEKVKQSANQKRQALEETEDSPPR